MPQRDLHTGLRPWKLPPVTWGKEPLWDRPEQSVRSKRHTGETTSPASARIYLIPADLGRGKAQAHRTPDPASGEKSGPSRLSHWGGWHVCSSQTRATIPALYEGTGSALSGSRVTGSVQSLIKEDRVVPCLTHLICPDGFGGRTDPHNPTAMASGCAAACDVMGPE